MGGERDQPQYRVNGLAKYSCRSSAICGIRMLGLSEWTMYVKREERLLCRLVGRVAALFQPCDGGNALKIKAPRLSSYRCSSRNWPESAFTKEATIYSLFSAFW